MSDKVEVQADRATLRAERQALVSGLEGFQKPSAVQSLIQLSTTLAAYIVLLALIYISLPLSLWLTAALVLPAAGLVVRLFTIQHDCGHGAYFRSQWANELAGRVCSIVTLTPFANWRRHHAAHHAAWNNLDQRHEGIDIYVKCITLREYQAMPRRGKWLYRLGQHPFVTQFLIPPFVFLLIYRTPFDTPRSWWRERRSVLLTNIAQLVLFGALIACFGWETVAGVHLPIIILASIVGIWMFAVQHRFEGVKWLPQEEWSSTRAALHGTSYFKLPRILQWFTGNIGFHHVHHLLPRVPNYRLEACHEALVARGTKVNTLTIRDALRAPRFVLWDEAANEMVAFPA
jgi:omega-6 fatty acid desaturase (delta-12 desaturase)